MTIHEKEEGISLHGREMPSLRSLSLFLAESEAFSRQKFLKGVWGKLLPRSFPHKKSNKVPTARSRFASDAARDETKLNSRYPLFESS